MPPRPLEPSHAADHPVYAVAGGNHVTVLLDRAATAGAFDVIDVLAQPGGGPPPHRHTFLEWFRVLDGELTLSEERDGVVRPTRVLGVGDTCFVPSMSVHATLNLSDAPCRFQVVCQPALISDYFAEAGVLVPDETTSPDREPPGPSELGEISARYGIEFWTGRVSHEQTFGS